MSDDAAGGAPLERGVGPGSEARCWCLRCRPLTLADMRMAVCPSCGDKRCVHAGDHEAPCPKDDIYAHNAWVERRHLESVQPVPVANAIPLADLIEQFRTDPAKAAAIDAERERLALLAESRTDGWHSLTADEIRRGTL